MKMMAMMNFMSVDNVVFSLMLSIPLVLIMSKNPKKHENTFLKNSAQVFNSHSFEIKGEGTCSIKLYVVIF